MAPPKLHIIVRTITGKEIELVIEPHFTITQIKELIEADSGIPPDQQWLISGGRRIDKEKLNTAEACNIEDGATLNLVLTLRGGAEEPSTCTTRPESPWIAVTIQQPSVAPWVILIQPTYTIQMMKRAIEAKTGIPPVRQQLVHSHYDISYFSTITAEACDIQEGSVLHLVEKPFIPDTRPRVLHITVSRIDTLEQIPLEIEPHEEICVIKDLLDAETGVTVDTQRLIFRGRQLEDGKIASDYDIEDGTKIHLVFRLRGS